MIFSITPFLPLATLALPGLETVHAAARGVPWGCDNQWAPTIAHHRRLQWYYHWALGTVPGMDVEYVPQCWGPAQYGSWNERVSEIKKKKYTPKYLLAFNEPDVSGQANMSPSEAAEAFVTKLIDPFGGKFKVGSPAIAYSQNWMASFLELLHKKGHDVEFIVLHSYGSWKDLAGFKKYVTSAHKRFGKKIWVTEMGVTVASGGSQEDIKKFAMDAISWLDTQSYVERVSWTGGFPSNDPPDGYATGKDAFFEPGGKRLTDLGYWYVDTDRPDKRDLRSRHHVLARNGTDTGDATDSPDDAIHCDWMCQARNAEIDDWEASVASREVADVEA